MLAKVYENDVIKLTYFLSFDDKIKYQNFSFNCQIFYNYLMYYFITDNGIAKKNSVEH